MIFKSKLMTAILFSMAAISSHAAPFSNGVFNNTKINNSYLQLEIGSKEISPWEVTKGNVDLINTYWTNDQNEYSLDMIGADTTIGEISQTFDTEPNTKYEVSFRMSGNPDGGNSLKTLDVSMIGTSVDTLHYEYDTKQNKTVRNNMNWQSHSFEFVASESKATIIFKGNSSTGFQDAFGAAISRVEIKKVDGGTSKPEECCCKCCK